MTEAEMLWERWERTLESIGMEPNGEQRRRLLVEQYQLVLTMLSVAVGTYASPPS